MALKKCGECGHEVSTKADSCPQCGAKREKKKNVGCVRGFLILVVIGIVGSGIIGSIISKQTEESAERAQVAQQATAKKKENEKRAFEKNISDHYSELVKLVNDEKVDAALEKASRFKTFGRLDYEDVNDYYTSLRTKVLAKKVRKLPASDVNGNLKLHKELLALNPGETGYKSKVEYYQEKMSQLKKEQDEKAFRASCKLELLSSNWKIEHGYAIFEGQIKNIASTKLENVQAVATWFDRSGNMITSSSALIEYNPIMPGQSSPFKVMKTANPTMAKASVEFSELMGGTFKTYRGK